MKNLVWWLFLLFISSEQAALAFQDVGVIQKENLKAAYHRYNEKEITHRRFKHADIKPLIEKRKVGEKFTVQQLGKSVENREIYQLGYGEGNTKVMLWSQMHGNESTATMSLLDIFNFLEGEDDGFEKIRNTIKDRLDIRFIPMVNPDGAEAFKRRNAYDIDLNRDAIQLTSPEAVILRKAREDFSPEYGFNLHDQQIYYNVEKTAKPATISVLAPAYNFETEVNDVRKRALQVIVGMNRLLQELIPGQVGKYDDAFEPRAFGDNFQKWGTSTILIESGGFPNDPEKQYIREVNFMIILNALYTIAEKSYEHYDVAEYFLIPDNDSKLMDVMLRSVSIKQNNLEYKVDLGIKRREIETRDDYYTESSIVDIGDLSVYYGYHDIDAEGYVMKEGKVWNMPMNVMLSNEKAYELLKNGFLAITYQKFPHEVHHFPINILKKGSKMKSGHAMGSTANFFLEKDGNLDYAVVNGYLIDLNFPLDQRIKLKVF